jgi:type IV pilus assembly protein PilW
MIEVKMRSSNGFTLVELMVAMAISLLVMGSIYSVYQSQQRSYVVQEQVTAMQQNLRAGMAMLTRDIRMAGYDPTRANNLGITVANNNGIQFTRRDDSDTTTQTITYNLSDNDLDGIDDRLDRNNQMVAENIDALNFVYVDQNGNFLDDDGSGNVTINIASIRSIQATILARTGRGDPKYVNTNDYLNQRQILIYTANDNNRRMTLTREIKCRNLGL